MNKTRTEYIIEAPLDNDQKRKKYLGINLTRNVQNLCEENYKKKEKEKDQQVVRHTVFLDCKIQYLKMPIISQ